MSRFSLHRAAWQLVPAFGDLFLFFVALKASLLLRQPSLIRLRTFGQFLPLFTLWLAVFYAIGLYDMRQTRNFVALIGNLMTSFFLCFGTSVAYFYLLSPYFRSLTPKTHLLVILLLSHAGVLAWRRAWLALMKFHLLKQRIVFLGNAAQVQEIEKAVSHLQDIGFSPVAWTWPGVDVVVADSSWVEENWAQAKAVFLSAVKHGVPVIALETFYESVFGKVSPSYAGRPSWALNHILPGTNGLYFRIKRGIDVVIATSLLIALAPVWAIIMVAIALFDGRPVFYGQKRLGFLGRPFTVWKFRTMALSADERPFSSANEDADGRISPLGRFLRRSRLDELPQLRNVLQGEMSLVGPRPEWVKEIVVLEKTVPNYHLRHLVMPGITGWAQVQFRATNNADDSNEKLQFDLYYLKNLSFALDIAILLKTVKRVFVKDSGIGKHPTPALLGAKPKSGWAEEAISQSGDQGA